MITCETPFRKWVVEGEIGNIAGSPGGEGCHVGVEDLSDLLAEYFGLRVRVLVELVEEEKR